MAAGEQVTVCESVSLQSPSLTVTVTFTGPTAVQVREALLVLPKAIVPELLLQSERRRFLEEEWPRLREKVLRLRLWPQDLFGAAAKSGPEGEAAPAADVVKKTEDKKAEAKKTEGDK